jgi:hypothetical protein
MHRNWTYRLILASGLVASLAHAQKSCVNVIRIDGTISYPTGAVIPGAQVRASNGETATTDSACHSCGCAVVEDLLQGYTEDVRDAESDFERGRALVALDGVDGLAVTRKLYQRRNAAA